ncbi:hypothetical protein AAC03nite_24650 [Alicyclobacillus acidoterrestris]|nr:hypothetical protein AAC03nite_24650 [Alicyclobacillus acidoterrestris]
MSRPVTKAKGGGQDDDEGQTGTEADVTGAGAAADTPAPAGTADAAVGAAAAVVSNAPLGPPSLNWTDEPLDPEDERILRRKANPRSRVGSRYVWVHPDTRKATLQVHSDALYHAVMRFFQQEAAKLAEIIGAQPPIPSDKEIRDALKQAMDAYDWTPWRDVLRPQVQQLVQQACEGGAKDMWDALRQENISLTWDAVATYARKFGMQRAAELVGMHVTPDGKVVPAKNPKMRIDEDTRKALQKWLHEQLKAGLTWQEIADELDMQGGQIGFPYMSDWRARRIARTEAAFAYNRGQFASLRDAGIGKVEVIDGTQDDICATVNHKIWTLEEAEANPLGHPHCSRHFIGIIE